MEEVGGERRFREEGDQKELSMDIENRSHKGTQNTKIFREGGGKDCNGGKCNENLSKGGKGGGRDKISREGVGELSGRERGEFGGGGWNLENREGKGEVIFVHRRPLTPDGRSVAGDGGGHHSWNRNNRSVDHLNSPV